MNITFTHSACAYIQKMLEKNSGMAFRLSIKKTGCSGYSYHPSIVTSIHANDFLMEAEGIKIAIDPVWAHLLEGLTVDYIEEEKSGLKQKKLVFSNPNESTRCGCGESFHVEKSENV